MSDSLPEMPGVNIELKLKVADLKAVEERALSIGAKLQWQRRQEDLFFRVPRGRLKLRLEEGRGSELIAYFRDDTPEARDSRYIVVPCINPAALGTALGHTLGVLGAVKKVRTLLTWRNVRIHLDEVESLGDYVELESVVGDSASREEAHENLQILLQALELQEAERIPSAYVELLAGGTEVNTEPE